MKLFICMLVFVVSNVAYAQEEDQTLVDDTKQVSGEVSAEAQAVTQGLEKFFSDCGRFPTTQEGLRALVVKPKKLKCKDWKPYLTSIEEKSFGKLKYVAAKKGHTFELK